MEEKLKEIIKLAVSEVMPSIVTEAVSTAIAEAGLMPQQSDGFPEIMNLKQAASFLHLTESYIKNNKTELGIPYQRIGRRYVFLKSELSEWVQNRSEKKGAKISIRPAKTKKGTVRLV